MLTSKDPIKKKNTHTTYPIRVCFITVFTQWFQRCYSIVILFKASKYFQDMKIYFEKNWSDGKNSCLYHAHAYEIFCGF